MDPTAAKFDFKMLVMPAVMIFSKKIDFKNPEIVYYLQISFTTAAALVLSLYYYVYTRINAKNDTKAIWVPPKPKPALPFGLGPAPEPVEAKDFQATNYKEYETKELKAAAQSIIMSVAITFFMSLKIGVHMSLLIQSIMMPLNAYDLALVKKYVMGVVEGPDGGLLYNESFKAPTDGEIAIINKKSAEAYATTQGTQPDEKKVEELPAAEDKKDEKDEKKSESKDEKKKSTAAASIKEID